MHATALEPTTLEAPFPFTGTLDCFGVPGVRVAHDPRPGVGCEHPLETGLRVRCSVSHDDHAGMDGVTDAHTAPVVNGHPGRTRGRVDEREFRR